MKPITLFFAVLLAVVGFGAGVLVGRPGWKTPSILTKASRDSSAAAPDANKLPAVKVKSRPAHAAAHLSLAEIETALTELKSLSRAKLWEHVNEIAKAVDPADIPQVMALVAALPNDLQSSIRQLLVVRWAEIDPRAAIKFGGDLKNFSERSQAILSALRGWAKNDAPAAVAWIEQLPLGQLRNAATGTIARALAESDPEAAFALLKNTRADRNSGYSAYSELFDSWAVKDPAKAAARAEEIKNWQQRLQAYQSIARRWVEADAPSALSWAKKLPDPQDRSSAMSAVLGAWAANDPQAATEAALAMPAGQPRNRAIASHATAAPKSLWAHWLAREAMARLRG